MTFVDSVESARAVRVGSRMGMTMPAHCTSSGKALLATLEDGGVRELYPKEKLTGLTSHSITKRSVLLRQLAEVRLVGFARSDEESEDEVASLSVSLGEYGGARYSLTVSMPKSRMSDVTREEIAAALAQAVDEVAAFFL